MRRFIPIFVAGVALVAVACSDATAPTLSTIRAEAAAAGVFNARKAKPVSIPAGVTQSFTIPLGGGPVDIGDYTVTFPANALCHPSSGYGKRFWDKDCAAYGRDTTIQAAFWVEDDGDVYVEFLANLRFDPSKYVFISIDDPRADTERTSAKEILYWSRTSKGRQRFNEGNADATLRTFAQEGTIARRIKHFTGYVVASGKCDAETDPDCADSGDQ